MAIVPQGIVYAYFTFKSASLLTFRVGTFALCCAIVWLALSGAAAHGDQQRLEQMPDIRYLEGPYEDLTWGLPLAFISGSRQDIALFFGKLLAYSPGPHTSDLPPPLVAHAALSQLLLDTPDRRLSYHRASGVEFQRNDYRASARSIARFYTRLKPAQREELVSQLSIAYEALFQGNQDEFRATIQALRNRPWILALKPPPTPTAEAIAHAKRTLRTVFSSNTGRVFDVPITAGKLDCSGFRAEKAISEKHRIVIDPGHFGGAGVQDSREYRGYREGRATLVTASLAKAFLVECAGLQTDDVILTRPNLYSLPGNDEVSFGNNALLYYRSELLALLQPDLAVSLHSDGGPQRISAYVPGITPQYYFYRSRGFQRSATITTTASKALAQRIIKRLEGTLHPLREHEAFAALYQPQESQLEEGRDTLFQNLFDSGIPMVLVEGFSHAPPGMPEFLTAEAKRSERIQIGEHTYAFNPLLRHYAKGVALAINDYLTLQRTD